MFLNILQLPFNNLLALFGYRKVVLLGDFAAGVAHLVAEQVGGRVLFGEAGAVGMAQVVVLEVFAEFARKLCVAYSCFPSESGEGTRFAERLRVAVL